MIATLLIAALLAAPAPQAAAQDAPRELSALAEPLLAEFKIPGIACAIVDSHGTLIARGAAGVRKAGDPTLIGANDRFHLGSCTKAMTATLIAMLVEEEQLDWDTKVGEFWAGKLEKIDPGWRSVTIEQLLQHRGGVPAAVDPDLWTKLRHSDPPRDARLDWVANVLSKAPLSPPGKTFLYSNANYVIAGAMAESVTKKPWEELMRARLFEPLGMQSAGFGAPGSAGQVDHPWGHTAVDFAVDPGAEQSDNPPAIGPAGTVHATLADWGRFVALHMAGERGATRLLSQESFARLHAKPEGGDYALGWNVVERNWAGKHVLNHAGSNTLWYCVVWAAPERDFAILVACNIGGKNAEQACDKLASKLVQDQLAALSAKR